jgi:cytochrome c-type biogenesis protein CcmH
MSFPGSVMLLWLVFAALSAAVLVVLLRPLMGRGGAPSTFRSGMAASAVYRDQLAEIEADLQRGLIRPDEAEAARTEIARRLLATVPASPEKSSSSVDNAAMPIGPPVSQPSRRASVVAVVLGVALPVAAIAAYLATGEPGMPAQPFAQRQSRSMAEAHRDAPDIVKLVAAVEARLKEKPDDGRGWEVVAPVYLQLGRNDDALHAYKRAIALNGASVGLLAGLAEASMLANDGRVLPEAREALRKILALEPGHVQARFWLAHGKEQDGDIAGARKDFQALLAQAPPGAPWREPLEQRLAALGKDASGTAPAGNDKTSGGTGSTPPVAAAPAEGKAPRGPTASDIAAAGKLSTDERKAMIEGMVSGLAARLQKDGRDLAGWQKLVRAYVVMGRRDDAVAALARARKSLSGELQSLEALTVLARDLGLGS